MGLFPVDPFIGFAERADALFDVLHKIKDHPFLVVTGMEADWTEFAYLCQGSVKGGGFRAHSSFFPTENALPSSGPTE